MKRGRKQLPHVFVGDTECKWCSGCKQNLPLDRFAASSPKKQTPDGLQSRCRSCVRARDNAWTERRRAAGIKSKTVVPPGAKWLRIAVLANGRRVSPRLANTFYAMHRRCNSERTREYPEYGGRGIKICAEWLHNYEAFREWALANGFRKDLTIDRIDGTKGYSPDNCRWATAEQQVYNTKSVHKLTLNGVTKLLPIWAKELRLPMEVLRVRKRNGWPDEHVLTVPLGGRCPGFPYKKPGKKPQFSATSSPLEK